MRLPRFPDAPPANPSSDVPYPVPAPDNAFVAAMVRRLLTDVSRVCAISTESESLEILLALSGRLAESNPAPRPRADAPFPGIFAGSKAGDFAGLPPAPAAVTARVPELAARLGEIGELFGSYLYRKQSGMSNEDYGELFVASMRLQSVIDELAAEAGDQ